jgi:dihydrofolate reductase
MQTINLIAAIGKQGQIGQDGDLPWADAPDLAFFREMTMGGIVVFGQRTFDALAESQPNKGKVILPGRIVKNYGRHNNPANYLAMTSLMHPGWPIWIAGGAATYRAFAPYINGLKLISVIDYAGPADTFFPFDAFGMEIK